MPDKQAPRPVVLRHSPEVQKRIDAFRKQIGPAFVKALNHGV